MKQLEKFVLLQTIDAKWKDHLYTMDALREGIGLRAYGQRDPLVEYRREAFETFSSMMDAIRSEAVEFIFRAQPAGASARSVFSRIEQQTLHPDANSMHDMREEAKKQIMAQEMAKRPGGPPPIPSQGPAQPVKRQTPKVGRNDPCPCGSGKKYKRCCGKNE